MPVPSWMLEDARTVVNGPGGLDVEHDGSMYRGVFDHEEVPEPDESGDMVLRNRQALYVLTGEPVLDDGDDVLIQGEAYVVHGDPQRMDDGVFSRSWVVPA